MNGQTLVERRKWFRVFPEGTLEFFIITRVLALLMLMALAIVGGTERPLVVVCLLGVLWVDYVLLLWWVVQVGADLQAVANPASDATALSRRLGVAVKAALPSVAAVVALMPWASLLAVLTGSGVHPAICHILPAVAGLVFLGLVWPAYRALRSLGLGSPLWTVLLLVPLLHFFALHRIASGLEIRLDEALKTRGGRPGAAGNAGTALILADVTWVLSVLPWVLIMGIVAVRGWPATGAFRIGPVCGTILAAVFAIANLAALEAVQRKFVALIHKT